MKSHCDTWADQYLILCDNQCVRTLFRISTRRIDGSSTFTSSISDTTTHVTVCAPIDSTSCWHVITHVRNLVHAPTRLKRVHLHPIETSGRADIYRCSGINLFLMLYGRRRATCTSGKRAIRSDFADDAFAGRSGIKRGEPANPLKHLPSQRGFRLSSST